MNRILGSALFRISAAIFAVAAMVTFAIPGLGTSASTAQAQAPSCANATASGTGNGTSVLVDAGGTLCDRMQMETARMLRGGLVAGPESPTPYAIDGTHTHATYPHAITVNSATCLSVCQSNNWSRSILR